MEVVVEVDAESKKVESKAEVEAVEKPSQVTEANTDLEAKATDAEEPDTNDYTLELDQLDKLGFRDRAFNLQLLRYKRGKLLAVLTFLTA